MIRRLLYVLFGAALAGCQGELTLDLATETPADPSITEVTVPLLGLEFITDQGATRTLQFREAQRVDLMRLNADNSVMRLFTDESLPEGRYTGVRLLLESDARQPGHVAIAGRQHELDAAPGSFATLAFSIEADRASSEAFTLVLDLRRSLRQDGQRFRLEPVLRATSNDEAARISGAFELNCNPSVDRPAMYLYQGDELSDDDAQRQSQLLAMTTPRDGFGAGQSYALRWLPPGRYTLGATCHGQADAGDGSTPQLRYVRSLRLERRGTVTENFP